MLTDAKSHQSLSIFAHGVYVGTFSCSWMTPRLPTMPLDHIPLAKVGMTQSTGGCISQTDCVTQDSNCACETMLTKLTPWCWHGHLIPVLFGFITHLVYSFINVINKTCDDHWGEIQIVLYWHHSESGSIRRQTDREQLVYMFDCQVLLIHSIWLYDHTGRMSKCPLSVSSRAAERPSWTCRKASPFVMMAALLWMSSPLQQLWREGEERSTTGSVSLVSAGDMFFRPWRKTASNSM